MFADKVVWLFERIMPIYTHMSFTRAHSYTKGTKAVLASTFHDRRFAASSEEMGGLGPIYNAERNR